MAKKYIKKTDEEEENVFWVTMSDMLLGLMMVFMTLFVLAMTGYTQKKMQEQQVQTKIAKELIKNMKQQHINAEIDDVTGQVKISNMELFDVSSAKLSPKGEAYLSKFIPIYVNTIFSNPKLYKNVKHIVIEGHTDSQMFKNVNSKEEQFTKNMGLSLQRANSVEDFMFKTRYNKNYTDPLKSTLLVEGRSFNDPVLIQGKEDHDKSRRVELKIVVKDSNIQDFLIKK